MWLSQENQYDYKAAYDLAFQTDGKTLPVSLSSALMRVLCTIRLKRLMNLQISTRRPLSIYKRYWKMAGIIKMQ